jgi:hypothetical protein
MDEAVARAVYVDAVQRGETGRLAREFHDTFVAEHAGETSPEVFRTFLTETLGRSEAHEIMLLWASLAGR